jgi:hypothetical protein
MYMVVKVKGCAGYLASQSGAPSAYQRLASDDQAPYWPLPVSYALMLSGVLTIFGSILLN